MFCVCACICAKYECICLCAWHKYVRECVFVSNCSEYKKMQMYTVNDVLLWAHLNCMCVRVPAGVCMCVGVFVQILLFIICVLV